MKNDNDLQKEQVDNSLIKSNSEEFGEEIPNAITIAALEEIDDMINHPEKYKSYSSFEELMKDLDD